MKFSSKNEPPAGVIRVGKYADQICLGIYYHNPSFDHHRPGLMPTPDRPIKHTTSRCRTVGMADVSSRGYDKWISPIATTLYCPRQVEIYCQLRFIHGGGPPVGPRQQYRTGVDVKDAHTWTPRPPGPDWAHLDRNHPLGHHGQPWVHGKRLLTRQPDGNAAPSGTQARILA